MEKIIKTHRTFDKHYRKRILPFPKLDQRFKDRVKIFISNPKDPLLDDHPLSGDREGQRSFSIKGDIRVIYQAVSPNEVILLDVGSHNQVY